MGVGSVVMATAGDEAVLCDAIPVTGKERIVLFGAPAACTVELYRQRGRSWNRDAVWPLAPGPSPAEQELGPAFPEVHRRRR